MRRNQRLHHAHVERAVLIEQQCPLVPEAPCSLNPGVERAGDPQVFPIQLERDSRLGGQRRQHAKRRLVGAVVDDHQRADLLQDAIHSRG